MLNLQRKLVRPAICAFALILIAGTPATKAQADAEPAAYSDLLLLFSDWRAFETPPMRNGAPDYTAATFASRAEALKPLRARLDDMDISGWPVSQQVDWHLVRAEMNGFDFNHRVLKPWVRDPAFYQVLWMDRSDVPRHEGPTNHAVVEVWTYDFPLSTADDQKLVRELSAIPPFMAQARVNLTGNAREMWIAGIRNIRAQKTNLGVVRDRAGSGASAALLDVIARSEAATDELADWLEAQASSKTGPSGIGKENYTWYQQNVHLVPLTWDDEVRLLKRELDRAWSSLALEEHRNRDLPELVAASTPEEFEVRANGAVDRMMAFLEDQDIMTVKDYMEPAFRAHRGGFVPEERRNFFTIGAHYDPLPLLSHSYHWTELARMDLHPHVSPVRQGGLLYNIYDSRNEGTATGLEEMFMHAGLYEDSPRSREIVWILVAQRAARGLGSLYAHANEMTMEEAGMVHMDGTPRGWMKTEKDLLIFEQHLYLRQPGYGTSYITGKYLLERTLGDYKRLVESRGETFRLSDFFDRLNAIDSIPISLGRWEMTGLDDEIRMLTADG